MLKAGVAVLCAGYLPRTAAAAYAPEPDGWRRFEITTRVEISRSEPVKLWLPLPSVDAQDWMEPGETLWSTNADQAARDTDSVSGAGFVYASWTAGVDPAVLELRNTVSTQDRHADLSRPGSKTRLSDADRALYTVPTRMIPTDGIVRKTADSVTAGAQGDLEKARRIYDWVVESTARNPETRGCGLGDVASMLQTGDLTGKCADLNSLYVGLARAAGLPARDVYGLRVAPSEFGYKSLGANSSDVTKAQHCRAEVFLDDFGWIAVDPADVRKVMLEEPPKDLPIDDPKVTDARRALFGGWEGNWIAYNFAHDLALPGAADGPVDFLMYPQAEVGGVRLDPLEPGAFAYTITAREVPA
jgi:transglutaminase-like putative cysteine protease